MRNTTQWQSFNHIWCLFAFHSASWSYFNFLFKVLFIFLQGTCALSVSSFYIFSMKLTTLFALHSQKMWIHTCMQYTKTNEWQKGVSPLWLLFSKKRAFNVPLAKQLYITCQGLRPHLSNWTNSNSFAITLEIPFGLNSSAYLYA